MGEAGVAAVVDRQLGDAACVRAQAIGFEAGVTPRQRRDSGPLDRTNHGQRISPCVSRWTVTQRYARRLQPGLAFIYFGGRRLLARPPEGRSPAGGTGGNGIRRRESYPPPRP